MRGTQEVNDWRIGGIAGWITGEKIINSYNNGDIIFKSDDESSNHYINLSIGGIVGEVKLWNQIQPEIGGFVALILNSYNAGKIEFNISSDVSKSTYLGMIIGKTDYYVAVMNTYNIGDLDWSFDEITTFFFGFVGGKEAYYKNGCNNFFEQREWDDHTILGYEPTYGIGLNELNNKEKAEKLLKDLGYDDLKLKKWIKVDSINNGYPILVDDVADKTDDDNVKFETYDIYVPQNTKLLVKENSSNDFVKKSLDSSFEKYISYDIKLMNGNKQIQPTGDVKVKIKIPDNFNTENLDLYYINENSSKEKVDFKVENNYLEFTTNHFSTYAIVDKDSKIVVDNKENEESKVPAEKDDTDISEENKIQEENNIVETTQNPKTGDTIIIDIVITIISLILISLMIAIKNKKNKKHSMKH